MNIIEIIESPNLEKIKKEENFLSTMFDKVFMICKQNSLFNETSNVVNEIDSKIEILDKKIKKQESLIEQADSMNKDLTRKYNSLSNENFNLRAKLLEMLGSEI